MNGFVSQIIHAKHKTTFAYWFQLCPFKRQSCRSTMAIRLPRTKGHTLLTLWPYTKNKNQPPDLLNVSLSLCYLKTPLNMRSQSMAPKPTWQSSYPSRHPQFMAPNYHRKNISTNWSPKAPSSSKQIQSSLLVMPANRVRGARWPTDSQIGRVVRGNQVRDVRAGEDRDLGRGVLVRGGEDHRRRGDRGHEEGQGLQRGGGGIDRNLRSLAGLVRGRWRGSDCRGRRRPREGVLRAGQSRGNPGEIFNFTFNDLIDLFVWSLYAMWNVTNDINYNGNNNNFNFLQKEELQKVETPQETSQAPSSQTRWKVRQIVRKFLTIVI